jgi:Na+/melibiose symporter-like transporter
LRLLFAIVPASATLLAAMALRPYALSRETMVQIRSRLETRRGAV